MGAVRIGPRQMEPNVARGHGAGLADHPDVVVAGLGIGGMLRRPSGLCRGADVMAVCVGSAIGIEPFPTDVDLNLVVSGSGVGPRVLFEEMQVLRS